MSYAALDIFQHLRQEDIHWMLASSELKTIPPKGVLVREDDPSETIFFIADGLFEVYVYDGTANRLSVGHLGAGEVVGEISWLDRRPISATVRAKETSSVIALSIAALERKLSEDQAFAARLFRSIATLAAERLRTTTEQLRRSEIPGGQRAAVAGNSQAAGVLDKVSELKKAVVTAEQGTTPENSAAIAKAFASLEHALGTLASPDAGKLAESLRAELLPLIRQSPLGERMYAQPRGYAGDYRTLEMINADAPSATTGVSAALDRCMLDLAVAKAIRNRRQLLAADIQGSYSATTKEFLVTCLACGPAAEIFDALEKAGDKSRLHASCIDIDRESLVRVAALARERNLSDQVQTLHGNLIYLATGRQELDLAPQDLIYSLNLADYLSDEAVLSLIDWIHAKLRPGGRAILGNFHPRNPSRGLMDQVLDWHVTHREEAAMNQLFAASKFAKPCSRIVFEAEGIYMLAECTK